MNKNHISIAVLISAVVLLVVGSFFVFFIPKFTGTRTNLWLGDGIFSAKLALDDVSRDQAWNDKTSLQANEALIMAYYSDNKWPINVKDMKVAIDIVWLDSDKKVVYEAKNITLDSTQTEITPTKNARFVIELPSGTIDDKVIHIGSTAVFEVTGDVK